jgi:hypothetical protein
VPQAITAILPAVFSGVGFLSNWLNNRTTMGRQQFLADLSKNPQKMNAYVNQFSRPLDQGLVAGTENQVQAALGERGLTGSPTITQDVMAQALGPLQQNEQQIGINEAMASLGVMPTNPLPQANLTLPLMMMMMNKGGTGATPSVDMSGITMGPSPSETPLPTDIFNFDNTGGGGSPDWGGYTPGYAF